MKKIILLFAILMLTGCSVNYTLTVREEDMTEKININIPMSETSAEIFYGQVDAFNSSYKIKTSTEGYNYIANLNRTFDYTDYVNSTFLSKCYDEVNITKKDSNITIKTSKYFHCIFMEDGLKTEKATVNIKTSLKVKESNADKVNDNVYTWFIDESNYTNKQIYLYISNSLIEVSDSTKNKVTNSLELISVMLIFIIPITILLLIIKVKTKGKNKI